jgi:hypothetical protein
MAKSTKVYAKDILNLWKGESVLFNGALSEAQFQLMLEGFGFKQSDAICITMACVVAGAKFKD